MKELIQQLEAAILRRNPLLLEMMRPGLPVEKIKKELKRASVAGAVDQLVGLYSWRDGTNLQGFGSEALEAGFTPPIEVELSDFIKQELLRLGVKRDTDLRQYNFIELKSAILYAKEYEQIAKHNPKMYIVVGRYFPILWDGATGWVAVDTEPSAHNRIVTIQMRDEQPLREAYDSFEDFLKDAIRANESNEPLACMRTPGKPITQASEGRAKPTAKAASPKAGKIPETENPLVLRTDFSDEPAWKSLCKALQNPDDEFSSSLDFVSDPTFDGLTAAELPSLLSEGSSHTFAFIVDRTALTRSGHPVLVIDLHDKPGRTFRVIASALGDIANNLSIANMDFDEFAKAVDKDGVFRGFGRRTHHLRGQ